MRSEITAREAGRAREREREREWVRLRRTLAHYTHGIDRVRTLRSSDNTTAKPIYKYIMRATMPMDFMGNHAIFDEKPPFN